MKLQSFSNLAQRENSDAVLQIASCTFHNKSHLEVIASPFLSFRGGKETFVSYLTYLNLWPFLFFTLRNFTSNYDQ